MPNKLTLTSDIQMDIIHSIRIYFYETNSGKSPIKKFIDGLPKSDQARFMEVFTEIEEHGLNASRVTFKPLEGKLW